MVENILLTKTKYINGLQCPKYLWVLFNDPGRVPAPDANTQYTFDQGHVVGELAKKLFPDGIDVPQTSFRDNIDQTIQLMKERKPLFEAGILAGNLYSRLDILCPANEDEWDIVEVKSSTRVKDVHIDDLSFQKICCEEAGLTIGKCYIVYINNKYVRNGEIDSSQLFIRADLTPEVENISVDIRDKIKSMLQVALLGECPEVIIGPHCREPYDCPLEECWEHLPESDVFSLYYSGKKAFDLYNMGIVSIKDIPSDYKLSDKQVIQKESLITGEAHLDNDAIKGFLSSLEYPLYYMDFETINPGVPLFNGARPYQNIPFQFSVHVVSDEHSEPKHLSFLAEGTQDPRPKLLKELQKALGDRGSIITYNKGFEEGILRGLAETFPGCKEWVNQVITRIVDLLTPFRNFDYYHPAQNGSASLKSVLPAVTGKGYENLDIAEGMLASIKYEKVTYGEVSDEERNKVRSDLEKYCSLDTEGMIWIVEKLKELCSQ